MADENIDDRWLEKIRRETSVLPYDKALAEEEVYQDKNYNDIYRENEQIRVEQEAIRAQSEYFDQKERNPCGTYSRNGSAEFPHGRIIVELC